MVEVLVILDGASEPIRPDRPTSLERAVVPTLDRLCASGSVSRVRTVPVGLPAGSETAIPVLLGWTPSAPVDRGALEAAARGVSLPAGHGAWRVDVVDEIASGTRADASSSRSVAADLDTRLGDHRVRHLAGHRLLVTGPPPLPAAVSDSGFVVWPSGAVPPRVLGSDTVVIAAPGAAAGAARLMGARVVVPAGATGGVDTDLRAKAHAALSAMVGAARVVVHVGAPDEAAHARDPDAKVAAIERADRELLAPLAYAVRAAGGSLQVCPDHGCDPETGWHDASPVPSLTWPGAGGVADRLTERAVSALPVPHPETLVAA